MWTTPSSTSVYDYIPHRAPASFIVLYVWWTGRVSLFLSHGNITSSPLHFLTESWSIWRDFFQVTIFQLIGSSRWSELYFFYFCYMATSHINYIPLHPLSCTFPGLHIILGGKNLRQAFYHQIETAHCGSFLHEAIEVLQLKTTRGDTRF